MTAKIKALLDSRRHMMDAPTLPRKPRKPYNGYHSVVEPVRRELLPVRQFPAWQDDFLLGSLAVKHANGMAHVGYNLPLVIVR